MIERNSGNVWPPSGSGFVTWGGVAPGRQVAGVDDKRANPARPLPRNPVKLRSAAQIAIRIDHLRLPEKWVMIGCPYSGGSGEVGTSMAIVAESRI
jgi:hypothetical protein